jgi:NhaP-type Na+/H+ or K+/H+ antiporter
MDPYENVLLAAGAVALLAAWLPGRLRDRPMSMPIVLVAIGIVAFALPIGGELDHVRHGEWFERTTELGVLVSLFGAGLKLDRPFGLRRWASTWRLLSIGMPLTIALVTLAGLAIGLSLGAALLVGAALSPTDPVLASDVQVGEPTVDEDADPRTVEDEVRFALTSEAGLNDGLAFPFVYAAIAVAAAGNRPGFDDLWRWVAVDLVIRIAVGVAVGVVVGRLLSVVMFGRSRTDGLAATANGFVALAATLVAYGSAELLHGYGFLAVFVAAMTIRSVERTHEYVQVLHSFAEEFEQLLVVGLLVLLGGGVVTGLLDELDRGGVLLGFALVLVLRPLACRVALTGGRTEPLERRVISFFGIRGIGSIYYLAYATTAYDFPEADRMWAIVTFTVLLSVAVHGVIATPAMHRVDRYRGRRRAGATQPAG